MSITTKSIPKRKSIRLKGYDYSSPGFYFITVCTNDRLCLFGEIYDTGMILNDAGRMIEKWFKEIQNKYARVICDAFVVMPNHFHGIIQIVSDLDVRQESSNISDSNINKDSYDIANENKKQGRHAGLPLQEEVSHPSISGILQWFKTMTTNDYIKGVKQNRWKPFDDKLWQRNCYEHVTRNEIDLSETREYIIHNTKKWHLDKYNPEKLETQRMQNV